MFNIAQYAEDLYKAQNPTGSATVKITERSLSDN